MQCQCSERDHNSCVTYSFLDENFINWDGMSIVSGKRKKKLNNVMSANGSLKFDYLINKASYFKECENIDHFFFEMVYSY